MHRGMPDLESREEVVLAFAEVSLAVDYLLQYQGRQRLIEFLERLGRTNREEGKFEAVEKSWDGLFANSLGPINEDCKTF